MKRLYPSIFLAAIVISAIAATVKISDLPISTSPSTNTFLEIADMDAVTKSSKYLLTNLVTQSAFTSATNSITTSAANWTASGTTNSTLTGVARANGGTFTNSLSAAGFNTSGTTNATLTGNLLANGFTVTNKAFFGTETWTPNTQVTIGYNYNGSLATGDFDGLVVYCPVNVTAVGAASSADGAYFNLALNSGAFDMGGNLDGIVAELDLAGAGAKKGVTVGSRSIWFNTGTGNISEAAAYYGTLQHVGVSVVTNMYGLYLEPALAGGSVQNLYGILVKDISGGSVNNYAIKTGAGTVSFGGATLVNSLVATNGITAGASTFTGTVTITNSAAASGGVDVQAVTGSTNYVLRSSINGATQFALYADAANTLAQRNGTSAQAIRVFNTYANNGTDYERGIMAWSGNVFTVGTESGGTGTARRTKVQSADVLELGSGGSSKWSLTTAGHLLANADNTYDIGASGATRPRTIYAGTDVRAGNNVLSTFNVYCGNTYGLVFSTHGSITSSSDGVFKLLNNAGTDFTRLQFGGTTTNYPAITAVTNVAGMPYLKFTDATGANLRKIVNAGHNGGRTNVLTDATATSVFWISVPSTNRVSGKLFYEIFATDGTESQGISGECKFIAVAKGTAVTAEITDAQTTAAVSAGTLAATVAKNVATNNVFAVTINSDTSLTTTNHTAVWRIESPNTFDVNAL